MRLAGIGCSAALVPVRSMAALRCRLPGGLHAGVVDAVAGVADGHHGALQVVGGGVGGEGDHVGDRDFDVETFLVVNSNAAARVPVVSSMSPSRVDCATMPATSSRV